LRKRFRTAPISAILYPLRQHTEWAINNLRLVFLHGFWRRKKVEKLYDRLRLGGGAREEDLGIDVIKGNLGVRTEARQPLKTLSSSREGFRGWKSVGSIPAALLAYGGRDHQFPAQGTVGNDRERILRFEMTRKLLNYTVFEPIFSFEMPSNTDFCPIQAHPKWWFRFYFSSLTTFRPDWSWKS